MLIKRDIASGNARNSSDEDDAVIALGDEWCAGWLIDSGTLSHTTPHQSHLLHYEVSEADPEVTIANNKKLQLSGTGTVKLTKLYDL